MNTPEDIKIDAEKILGDETKQKEAEEIIRNPDKVEELIKNVSEKLDRIPIVGTYFSDVPILCLMVRDYATGDYTDVPFGTVVGIVIALVYFLSPVDLIPDVIPGIGYLDDALVIGFAVSAAHNDIAAYRRWKGF